MQLEQGIMIHLFERFSFMYNRFVYEAIDINKKRAQYYME